MLQGMTCLHCAVHQDNLNGVNFLLQHAPDVTMADHKVRTEQLAPPMHQTRLLVTR